jgi:hypothetical protein
MARREGFEPPTARSVAWCSASIWSAPDGSRPVPSDRLDDQADDQAPSSVHWWSWSRSSLGPTLTSTPTRPWPSPSPPVQSLIKRPCRPPRPATSSCSSWRPNSKASAGGRLSALAPSLDISRRLAGRTSLSSSGLPAGFRIHADPAAWPSSIGTAGGWSPRGAEWGPGGRQRPDGQAWASVAGPLGPGG